jgi:hypothetical protein
MRGEVHDVDGVRALSVTNGDGISLLIGGAAEDRANRHRRMEEQIYLFVFARLVVISVCQPAVRPSRPAGRCGVPLRL